MTRKNPSIPYLYHCKYWNPAKKEDISILWEKGTRTSLYTFDPGQSDLQRYFCPECGYWCKMTSKPKKVGEVTIGAYFSHRNQPNKLKRPYCGLGSQNSLRKQYSSEFKKIQAETTGRLTRIPQWIDNENEVEDYSPEQPSKSLSDLRNVSDVDSSIDDSQQIRINPRRIRTLQFIIDHIQEFYCKDIELPGDVQPRYFQEVLFHSSEIDEIKDKLQYIVWGEVHEISLISKYLRIRFGYNNHCLDFALKENILQKRKLLTNELIGKTIAVAGIIGESHTSTQKTENKNGVGRPCFRVVVERRGAFAIISPEQLKFLHLPDDAKWVAPAKQDLIQASDGEQKPNPLPDEPDGTYNLKGEQIAPDRIRPDIVEKPKKKLVKQDLKQALDSEKESNLIPDEPNETYNLKGEQIAPDQIRSDIVEKAKKKPTWTKRITSFVASLATKFISWLLRR